MFNHTQDELKALKVMFTKIDYDLEYSIEEINSSNFIIRQDKNYDSEKSFKIESNLPLLFIGKQHCVFSNYSDLKSHFKFHKLNETGLKILKLEVDYETSCLSIYFDKFRFILLPQSMGGWLIYQKDVISIECIEYGGTEINPFLVEKYNNI